MCDIAVGLGRSVRAILEAKGHRPMAKRPLSAMSGAAHGLSGQREPDAPFGPLPGATTTPTLTAQRLRG
jgi:hypothetical protein